MLFKMWFYRGGGFSSFDSSSLRKVYIAGGRCPQMLECTFNFPFRNTAESRFSDCRFSEEPRFSEVFSADRIFMKQKL